MNITIKELVHIFEAQLILGDPRTTVHKACIDSRHVEEGDLFFALKGEHQDGHSYAMSAVNSRAGGVVVSHLNWLKTTDRFGSSILKVAEPDQALKKLADYIRRQFNGPVIGVTGSNGKTTTKQMLASIFNTTGPGLATSGNYNSQLGLPLVLSELKSDHRWIVLEMGASERGNIATLADIARPTISIITSIGPAHLKTFGSLQKVAQTKWEIIDALPQNGIGVVPWGEPLLQPLIRESTKKLVFFGEDSSCAVRPSSIEMGEKVKFKLHIGSQNVPVTLPVSGRFNVFNALAAAAAAWAAGVEISNIVTGLEQFEPAPMRMQIMRHSSGALVINDAYNANPASLVNSVRSVMESFPQYKKVVVIGSMKELGEESAAMHFNAGTELGRFALDNVFVLGPDTEKIIEGAQAVGAQDGRFLSILNPADLINKLSGFLNKDTLILFKGSRSMHLEIIVEALFS